MTRFALTALTAVLFAGGSTLAFGQDTNPTVDPDPDAPEAKQELLETQPQAKVEGATTGQVEATEEKEGAPATSGDTATLNQPDEGAEKQSNVESASEITEDKGETATIN